MTPNIPPLALGRPAVPALARPRDQARRSTSGTSPTSDGYDEQTIVDGLKIAREVAAEGPFADWIEREIAPGPDDHRATPRCASTAVRCTTRSTTRPAPAGWEPPDDDLAVVDPELRVRGIEGLSIADGSIFPQHADRQSGGGTFMMGEKAADLVRAR